MDDLKQKYLSQIADAGDENALEGIRLAAVGKKGEVALKMRELGKMTPEERQVAGPALNALKDEINSALAAEIGSFRCGFGCAPSRRVVGCHLAGSCASTWHDPPGQSGHRRGDGYLWRNGFFGGGRSSHRYGLVQF